MSAKRGRFSYRFNALVYEKRAVLARHNKTYDPDDEDWDSLSAADETIRKLEADVRKLRATRKRGRPPDQRGEGISVALALWERLLAEGMDEKEALALAATELLEWILANEKTGGQNKGIGHERCATILKAARLGNNK